MKNTFIVIGLSAIMFCACGKKKNTANYMYQNTFDNYKDFGFDHATLKSGNARSGEWYCELDTINQYSITYSKKVKDLPVKNAKKVKLSAWLYLPTFNARATVVATVGEQGKEAVMWNGLNTDDLVDTEKQWVQVTGEFALPANMNPEHTLQVYVWNHGKEVVWCDDVAFDFE
jgi:hypothetical protein